MRIICPNCDAQYEVDDAAIPAGGRDVQCSNCGHGWFQEREPGAEALTAELYDEPDPVPAASPALSQREEVPPEPVAPPRRTLDDSVLSVLREEAERAIAARKAESQGIELQGDLGLPPPVSVAAAAPAARESVPPDAALAAQLRQGAGLAEKATKPSARRDLLPDIEEINSTLKPGAVAAKGPQAGAEVETGSGGFRSGFTLMLVVAAAMVALYVLAPQITAQSPGLGPTLDAYVALVDAVRSHLDGLIRQATGFLQGLSGAA